MKLTAECEKLKDESQIEKPDLAFVDRLLFLEEFISHHGYVRQCV